MVGQSPIGAAIPLPLLLLLIGGGTLPIVSLLAERLYIRRVQEGWAILFSALSLIAIYPLYQELRAAPRRILLFQLLASPPLGGCFEVDALGVYMAGVISLLTLLAAFYSYRYMERESRLSEYYTLLLFMAAGMTGVALAGDFFTLFIFWEMMAISSYVLVAFLKHRWAPIEAGFKYLIMSATAGAFLLLSMSLLYGMAGTLNFAYLSASLRGAAASTPWILLLLSTLLIGFGVKSAIVPLHTWLPDAHPEAPSPISALLSGVVIETGLYAMTRVFYLIFDPRLFGVVVAALSLLTMTIANILALLQDDIKRMLAYSSIAQIGYMLIGVSTGTAYGVMGTFLHVFNHSLMKGLAFLATGNIVHETGTRDIKRLVGVGRRMPYTAFALFVALLGLGGIPSTSGFISKFILFSSAIGAGMPLLAVAGVLNSAFSMAYYMRVIKTLISTPIDEVEEAAEAPLSMLIVTLGMALLIILFGVYPAPTIRYASAASRALVERLEWFIALVVAS